jgi:hypothetical protein
MTMPEVVTVTATPLLWPNASVTVIVQVPAPVGVTVALAEGALHDELATVAMLAHESVSLKAPVPLSVTANVCAYVAPVASKLKLLGLTPSAGSVTVIVAEALCFFASLTVSAQDADPSGVTSIVAFGPLALFGVTDTAVPHVVAIANLPL